jgi:cyclomaltodextrinase
MCVRLLTIVLSAFILPPVFSSPPEWAADAVWYQIFPERFRNGDPKNDPVRASIDSAKWVPATWHPTNWTKNWFSRDEWEIKRSPHFYDTVFSRRYGGDLEGILQKLDYLSELGINAIYFNPVFHSPSMHKYDGASFHHIDPYFGPDPDGDLAIMETETADPATWQWTSADRLFLKLLKEARKRGIRVIIDGVFNHTGQKFFAFQNLSKLQGASPYKDWYIVKSFDDPATPENEFKFSGWWGHDALPEFAAAPGDKDLHPGPKNYIFQITRRWMDPDGDGNPSDGIDGWRLDVADEVPLGFWVQWNRLVRELNPEAVTMAETWHEAGAFIRKGGFTGAMNYHAFAIPSKGFLIDGQMPASQFAKELVQRREKLGRETASVMQNLYDSHDTDRVASMIVNRNRTGDYRNKDWFDYDNGEVVSMRASSAYRARKMDPDEMPLLRTAVLFQMTYVGAPMIYYGTEAGMWGADDPDNRQPMVWNDLTYEDQEGDPRGTARAPDPVVFDQSLFDYYKRIIALRHAHPALRRGEFKVHAADDDRQIFAFLRETPEERLCVAINRNREPQVVDLPLQPQTPEVLFFSEGKTEEIAVEKTPKGYRVTLPEFSSAVLKLR